MRKKNRANISTQLLVISMLALCGYQSSMHAMRGKPMTAEERARKAAAKNKAERPQQQPSLREHGERDAALALEAEAALLTRLKQLSAKPGSSLPFPPVEHEEPDLETRIARLKRVEPTAATVKSRPQAQRTPSKAPGEGRIDITLYPELLKKEITLLVQDANRCDEFLQTLMDAEPKQKAQTYQFIITKLTIRKNTAQALEESRDSAESKALTKQDLAIVKNAHAMLQHCIDIISTQWAQIQEQKNPLQRQQQAAEHAQPREQMQASILGDPLDQLAVAFKKEFDSGVNNAQRKRILQQWYNEYQQPFTQGSKDERQGHQFTLLKWTLDDTRDALKDQKVMEAQKNNRTKRNPLNLLAESFRNEFDRCTSRSECQELIDSQRKWLQEKEPKTGEDVMKKRAQLREAGLSEEEIYENMHYQLQQQAMLSWELQSANKYNLQKHY